jgi:flagellar basal-body rod protein FlgF
MDRMIYLSMAGAKMNMQRQDVLSTNLANVSTTGFRAAMEATRAVPVRGDGASTRVYSLETTVGYNDAAGPVTFTGRNLDVAVQGKSWLAVQGLDGTEAYTRAGRLEVSTDGQLVNSMGQPMLSSQGTPIDVPQGAEVTLGDDGTVTARIPGQQPTTVGRLKLATPTPDDPLKRGDDGLFRTASGDPLPADPNAKLQSGVLEGSNVNSVQAMVDMITAARQFEQQMQLLQTAQSDDKAASQLLNVNA